MQDPRSALPIITLLLALCFPITAGTTMPPAEPVARIQVVLVDGEPADVPTIEQLQVKRVGGTTESGRVGMLLFKHDEVTTGNGVEASLLFEKADPEYHVQVLMQEKSRARIESLWALVGRFLVSGWGSFDTKTQNVRLGKRATEFYVEVAEDGSVDVKVLRGEVEVEPVTGVQPAGEDSHARAMVQKLTLSALQGVTIRKGQRPTAARKLETNEVETVLAKTDKLVVASLAETTPLNVIPTSYELTPELAADPQRLKAAAETAFVNARHAATLTPTADTVASLGHAYKDLGAGKRAVKEYERASILNPALRNQVEFLAGQAEAYRLAGNLKKADEKSKHAVTRSELPHATPVQKQLALNTRSNIAYDLAVQSIAAGLWDDARNFFEESKTVLSAAISEPSDEVHWITNYNLNNTLLAIDRDDTTTAGTVSAKDVRLLRLIRTLMGTHRGLVSFPGAKLATPATLVINGRRFSLVDCEQILRGSIVGLQSHRRGVLFDVIFDANIPVRKISLIATFPEKNQIELASAPNEIHRFLFSTTTKQQPLTCLRALGLR